MKWKWILSVIAFFLCTAATSPQEFSVPYYSVGFLCEKAATRMCGTAFALEDPKILVTARHVAIDEQTQRRRELFFQPAGGRASDSNEKVIEVKPVLLLKREDLAILRILGTTPCKQALKRGDFSKLGVGTTVVYGGYNITETREMNKKVFVLGASRILHFSHVHGLSYFEVQGEAIPGYSGGPVLDSESNVVGIILKGIPLPDGKTTLFRAISIDSVPPVRALESKKNS